MYVILNRQISLQSALNKILFTEKSRPKSRKVSGNFTQVICIIEIGYVENRRNWKGLSKKSIDIGRCRRRKQ